ncbi:enoyl-CoA hydratase/isomerase family protein [Mycobacterium vicinigordonae]|uniref:Enoyl-CoA hydratase/isomerase family protein n=1 Tax=Mycobacterium vicinigordonae TaxID=1719132 RepID=A0A7D6DXS8_9MYCO|nr:enoyl-CoA hydratase/isomerase family protein [Mycobacterium vicinigordonae]QLL07404.1 enoyl-CoA hydratase/isomerase family protein [Mycobacterium vicinigordonae]
MAITSGVTPHPASADVDHDWLRVERIGPAAVVVFDRPQRRNSLSPPQARGLTALLEEIGTDPSISGVVLTGNGAFCAGGDMKAIVPIIKEGTDALRTVVYGAFQRLMRTLVQLPVPLVAAVDGAAVGFGFDLALACDCRFIGPQGWLQQGWAVGGAIPATGGVLFLDRIRPDLLWRLLDGQHHIDGPQAEKLGLGEATTGPAVDAAVLRVTSFAQMPRTTLRRYVDLARSDLRDRLESYLPVALDHQVACLTSTEFMAFTDRFRAQA